MEDIGCNPFRETEMGVEVCNICHDGTAPGQATSRSFDNRLFDDAAVSDTSVPQVPCMLRDGPRDHVLSAIHEFCNWSRRLIFGGMRLVQKSCLGRSFGLENFVVTLKGFAS